MGEFKMKCNLECHIDYADVPKITVGNPNVKSLIEELKQMKYIQADMRAYHKLAQILYSIKPYATLIVYTETSVKVVDIEVTLEVFKNTIERIK